MKKKFIIIIIYIVIGMLIIGGYFIKKDYDLTKNIEDDLNLSQEVKSNINYNNLIEDIKKAKKNDNNFNAKEIPEDTVNENNETMDTSGSNVRYQGEGYEISFVSGAYVADVSYIYEFYVGDERVYSVTSGGFGTVESTFSNIFEARYDILYFLISIIIVVIISIIIFKKKKSVENK